MAVLEPTNVLPPPRSPHLRNDAREQNASARAARVGSAGVTAGAGGYSEANLHATGVQVEGDSYIDFSLGEGRRASVDEVRAFIGRANAQPSTVVVSGGTAFTQEVFLNLASQFSATAVAEGAVGTEAGYGVVEQHDAPPGPPKTKMQLFAEWLRGVLTAVKTRPTNATED